MTNSSLQNKAGKGTLASHRSEVSSASRFYDNGADTSSSLSDNSYIDNHIITNNNTLTNKAAYSQVVQPPVPIGFKMNSSSPLKNNNVVIPPPVHQRTSIIFYFRVGYLSLSPLYFKGNSSNGLGRKEPCCRGIYDFDAETLDELEFKEGDMIRLLTRLDDNWYYLFIE